MKFDPRNRFYIELEELCTRKQINKKGLFSNANAKLLISSFLDNITDIVKSEEIYLEKIIPSTKENEEWLLNFINRGNKSLFIANSTRLEYVTEQKLVNLLRNMIEEELTIGGKKEMFVERDSGYHDVTPHEGSTRYYPLKNFNYSSFMRNAFLNSKIKYKFTKYCPNLKINGESIRTNRLVKAKLEIMSFLTVREHLTRKKWVCMHQSHKDGLPEICGRTIYFSPMDEGNKITCLHGREEKDLEPHMLKKSSAAIIDETINLYVYNIKVLGQKKEQEIIMESPVEINHKLFEANVLFSGFGAEEYNLIIAINEEQQEEEFEGVIFKRDEKNWSVLHDMFESIKEYLRTYHKIDVTSKGKIIAEFTMFQLVLQIYFNYVSKMVVFGTSGAGKSYWRTVLTPLFTNSYVVFQGSDVTRNRLLGGKPASDSEKFGSFLPGAIATHNYVIIEEMTDQLDMLYSSKQMGKDTKANVFAMLKGLDTKGDQYDVGVQGSKKCYIRASILLIGNLENLRKIRQTYVNALSKEYKRFNKGGQHFKRSWPIYKQIEYYEMDMRNEALAKAHQIVRENILTDNYITYLPEAEQGRCVFCIILEEDTSDWPQVYSSENSVLEKIHPDQIAKELNTIIKIGRSISELKSTKLLKSVKKFMNNYIKTKRNNYVVLKRKYNEQLLEKLNDTFAFLILLQRQYMDKKETKEDVLDTNLDDNEKALLEYYLLFNYNVLSSRESEMITKPYSNDLKLDTNKLYNEEFNRKEEEQLQKLKEATSKEPIKLNLDKDEEEVEEL